MSGYLSPPPLANPDKNSSVWSDWYRQLQKFLTTLGSLDWTLLDFTGSNLTDLATRNHNDLQNIQGGTTAQYYHLTSAQQTDLTDGGATTLHKHDHGGQDGLADDDHGHYWNAARGATRIALRI